MTRWPEPRHQGRVESRGLSLRDSWALWRQGLEYAGFRLVAGILTALPLDIASAFSGWCWRRVAPRLPRQQRALDNLRRAYPELSEAELRQTALGMWENLGRTFAEFFHMPEIIREGRIALKPAERFDAIATRPPFVVCSLHMGNWEILTSVGLRYAAPVAGVYQALTNPLVDRWLYEKRLPMYPAGLYDKSPATARRMLRLVREGGCPAFLADLRELRGVPVTFFGRTAMSNPFPALIARTQNVPMYAMRVRRTQGAHFEMRIEEVVVPRTDDRDADVLGATQNVQSWFETFIREDPSQWMWAHRRWD